MSGIGLLWAGLSLGGNLIAAPAKFQVSDLGLALALQVGRAQFTWLGYAEWVFLVVLLVSGVMVRLPVYAFYLMPVAIFLFQQFWVMPRLNARSDMIIAGEMPVESNLHVVFIVLEILKFLALTGTALAVIVASIRTAVAS
ncbi:MAG: hypothetical protein AAGF54_11990 [Pseudomonadota bacterium]